jgi:hypothetical protein
MNEDSQLRDLLTHLSDEAVGPTTMPRELGARIARRRRRQAIVGSSLGVAALAGAGALVAQLAFGGNSSPSRTVVMPQSDGSTPPAAEPTATPTPAAIGGEKAANCPSGALPLGGDADAAVRAALAAYVQKMQPDPSETEGATGTAKVATDDAAGYGGMAIQACGDEVAANTFVVTLHFPALEPSASLSNGVVFVSREESGWLAWSVVR